MEKELYKGEAWETEIMLPLLAFVANYWAQLLWTKNCDLSSCCCSLEGNCVAFYLFRATPLFWLSCKACINWHSRRPTHQMWCDRNFIIGCTSQSAQSFLQLLWKPNTESTREIWPTDFRVWSTRKQALWASAPCHGWSNNISAPWRIANLFPKKDCKALCMQLRNCYLWFQKTCGKAFQLWPGRPSPSIAKWGKVTFCFSLLMEMWAQLCRFNAALPWSTTIISWWNVCVSCDLPKPPAIGKRQPTWLWLILQIYRIMLCPCGGRGKTNKLSAHCGKKCVHAWIFRSIIETWQSCIACLEDFPWNVWSLWIWILSFCFAFWIGDQNSTWNVKQFYNERLNSYTS